ncbi:TlpA disulfide reductase family protein [Woodsholea maritima]|uniref:TlpA disulfide reductase family protein n=1 Tax=Woodsholea maritima TaxID=240237 RepID=UPI0003714933|nr:TlpA disulfide reductase family protein [Woodsholea maritima]
MTQNSTQPFARPRPAPEWHVESWLNTDQSLSLKALRGKVIVLEAFQMLCPGCVQSSLPQAKRVHALFSHEEVAVIGLHTVFEHHDAMTPTALKAFVKENQLSFPIGIDQGVEGEMLPATMARYNMQGTPTLVLIDRKGDRRAQHFGHIPDLQLGAEIMALMKAG